MTRQEAERQFGRELIVQVLGADPWYWDGDTRVEYLQDWQIDQLVEAQKKETK